SSLLLRILDRDGREIARAQKFLTLKVGASVQVEFSFTSNESFMGRDRIIATYTYGLSGYPGSYEVRDEEEITVGMVAVDLREPKKNAVFYIGEPILFDLSATTVNITTGEVEILDYASQQDFQIFDDLGNSYPISNFINYGNGNYSFTISIGRRGSYRIYVRLRDPISKVVGENYVDLIIEEHKVTLRLSGIAENANLYIPNNTIIDEPISVFSSNYLIRKDSLREKDYYIFTYAPRYFLGIFFNNLDVGDISYVSFNLSHSLGYYNLSLSQTYMKNSFILAYSLATKGSAIDRYNLIKEMKFFGLVNPTFGFQIKDRVNVKIIFDPWRLNMSMNLTGEELEFPQGLYRFRISNLGICDSRQCVEIRAI
ncbi:MAG: hypothetical protein QXX71_03545, partial [Candidatus Nanoarchaeia archaeon]|nr:hypothetical protein [Candidatus Haiyanarchaeum thermophilum]